MIVSKFRVTQLVRNIFCRLLLRSVFFYGVLRRSKLIYKFYFYHFIFIFLKKLILKKMKNEKYI